MYIPLSVWYVHVDISLWIICFIHVCMYVTPCTSTFMCAHICDVCLPMYTHMHGYAHVCPMCISMLVCVCIFRCGHGEHEHLGCMCMHEHSYAHVF